MELVFSFRNCSKITNLTIVNINWTSSRKQAIYCKYWLIFLSFAVLPRDGPHIRGQQYQYQIGEYLNLNCTSGKSHPASHLQWFVNEQPVSLLAPSARSEIQIFCSHLFVLPLSLHFLCLFSLKRVDTNQAWSRPWPSQPAACQCWADQKMLKLCIQ